MRRRRVGTAVTGVVAAALVAVWVPVPAAVAAESPAYTVSTFPLPAARPYGEARAVFEEPGGTTVLFEDWNADQSSMGAGTYNLDTGVTRDLAAILGGAKQVWVTGASSHGVVTGRYSLDGTDAGQRFFVWSPPQGLQRTWPVADELAFDAADVNDAGTVGGYLRGSEGNAHAGVWPASGPPVELGADGGISMVRALNDTGQAVGFAPVVHNYLTLPVAAVWCNGVEVHLTEPLEGNSFTEQARAVSPGGLAVGNYERNAFLWRDGKSYDLGLVNGASWATAVNDAGTVVGNSGEEWYPDSSRPWVSRQHEPARLLQDMVAADTPWDLRLALGLSPDGVIVGSGVLNGSAYLPAVLTPTAPQAPVALEPGSAQPGCRPAAQVGALPRFTLAPTITVRLVGRAVDSFDVRYRRAGYNGGFGGWTYPTDWQATTAGAVTLPAVRGATHCFSTRGRDSSGGVTPWSAEQCTAAPLDDRSLSPSPGGWSRATGSVFYAGTVTSGSTTRATLTRSGVQTRRIAVVATRCSGCGTLAVSWNGRLLRTISLDAATTAYRQVLSVADLGAVGSGTVVLTLSSSRRVLVDGLALSRT